MMSLLSVTVKKARYVGAQASQFNTYITLKLQNVKSTTVTVKGATPCWEQDFLFETNDINTGLLIEVWSKGMIWDRALGYHWIPLQTVQYSNEEGNGQWLSLEAELVMRDGEVVGTKMPTGHSLLVDCRFELPFDPENIEASDLQRKLEMLNSIADQEARLEQTRRQMQYHGHSGYSEDSDYTSDLNYPVGQHANSSASQFRSAAHQINTPQRSLETSRENSYERDDGPAHYHHLPQPPQTHQQHLSPGGHRRHVPRYSPNAEDFNSYGGTQLNSQNSRSYQDNTITTDSDPLFYNSRPRNKTDYSSRRRKYASDHEESQEAWMSCESNLYNQSVDSVDVGYSNESDYFNSQVPMRRPKALRRPSLERQTTLYDESYYGEMPYYPNSDVTQVNYLVSSQNPSCEEYFDSLSYPYQEERYGQEEEDRQWDSGGYFNSIAPPVVRTNKKLPAIPLAQNRIHKRRSSISALDEAYPTSYDESARPVYTPLGRRKMPQIPTKRSSSRQSSIDRFDGYNTPENTSHRGASLPPTPTKTPKVLARLANYTKPFNSLPPTPGRQLPKPRINQIDHRSAKARRTLMKRTSSAEYSDMNDVYDNSYMRPGAMSAREVYNEDYNYAYQSIDNLPAQPENSIFNDSNLNKNAVQYEQSIDDYYYNAQEEPDTYYNTVQNQAKIGSLIQQNTDSLESRDDELKDSYDTAVSSVNSSLHQIINSSGLEYSTAGEPITNPTPTVVHPIDSLQKTASSTMQYFGDHLSKAISAVLPSTTVAQVHNSRGYLKQQASVDSYYDQQLGNTLKEFNESEENYLEAQESIESYVEEDSAPNGVSVDYKAINHDSPSSVIHVESYEDDHSLRRGSSQITVVDPFHPSLQRPARRPSGTESYLARRTSGDAYGFEEGFGPSRKASVADSAGNRRGSLRHSPTPPEVQEVQNLDLLQEDVSEKKSVSFEEEEVEKQRPQVTAQQRWHWAYNKIIMQLNVSSIISLLMKKG